MVNFLCLQIFKHDFVHCYFPLISTVLFLPVRHNIRKVFTLITIRPFHLFFIIVFKIFLISVMNSESQETENGICGLK